MPLAYLTHSAHWRDVVLAVGPGVLIPRPETELMLDLAAAALRARPQLGRGPWLDLGTGSGALAVGLAAVLPESAQVNAHYNKCTHLQFPCLRVWSLVLLHGAPHLSLYLGWQ